jgi:hypothetical protein
MKKTIIAALMLAAACVACKKQGESPVLAPNYNLDQVTSAWSDIGDYTGTNAKPLAVGDVVIDQAFGEAWYVYSSDSAVSTAREGYMSVSELIAHVTGHNATYASRRRLRPSTSLPTGIELRSITSLAQLQSVDSVLEFHQPDSTAAIAVAKQAEHIQTFNVMEVGGNLYKVDAGGVGLYSSDNTSDYFWSGLGKASTGTGSFYWLYAIKK